MVVRLRGPALRALVAAFAATFLSIGSMQAARAQIQGCSGDAARAGDKIVIGSVAELAGAVGTRLERAMIAAFEMRFERAYSDLGQEAKVLYCDGRQIRARDSYSEGIVGVLNDEQVLLEVGARPDGPDIMVTYVVIPIRLYSFFGDRQASIQGYHEALYDHSKITAGLQELFKGNAELRLMAALALALRYEKIADGEHDANRRRELVHRSRAFYCDAVGSLEAARPREDFLGLPETEWRALGDFALAGAKRLFEKATTDPDYVGALSAVASERAASSADESICAQPPV